MVVVDSQDPTYFQVKKISSAYLWCIPGNRGSSICAKLVLNYKKKEGLRVLLCFELICDNLDKGGTNFSFTSDINIPLCFIWVSSNCLPVTLVIGNVFIVSAGICPGSTNDIKEKGNGSQTYDLCIIQIVLK